MTSEHQTRHLALDSKLVIEIAIHLRNYQNVLDAITRIQGDFVPSDAQAALYRPILRDCAEKLWKVIDENGGKDEFGAIWEEVALGIQRPRTTDEMISALKEKS